MMIIDTIEAMTPNSTPPAMAPWVSDLARERFASVYQGTVAPHTSYLDLRRHYDVLNRERLAVARTLFSAEVEDSVIAGVPVAIVRPESGRRCNGVLICLHGGAFMWGNGAGALLEAIPVAATSGRTVIAVDYRLAPEHRFPAAVDDIAAVYRLLAREHGAASIGMFGCSAGGILTAQVVARLLEEGDAVPGAIAMLHGTGLELGGDSSAVAGLLNAISDQDVVPSLAGLPFLDKADPADPLVFPGEHPSLLARFPPSLLVTGTRDFAASAVATMHRRLQAAGVSAELTMFDGMWHAHHVDTDLPEARETFEIVARFFDRHLLGR